MWTAFFEYFVTINSRILQLQFGLRINAINYFKDQRRHSGRLPILSCFVNRGNSFRFRQFWYKGIIVTYFFLSPVKLITQKSLTTF